MSVFPPFEEYEIATKTDINAFRCAKAILFIGALAVLCSIFLGCNSNKVLSKQNIPGDEKSKRISRQLDGMGYSNIYTFQRIR